MVMMREHFWELPLYLESGMLPIVISVPPYHFWEPPPEGGPLPMHGPDFGLFIVAAWMAIVLIRASRSTASRSPGA